MLQRITAVVALFLLGTMTALADVSPPEITAQGFDIDERQTGALAAFQRLRVRFEVPGRIEELRIKERSYEVDLATTPEAGHLPLFGLNRQVRQLTDVTLNFEAYINQKLEAPGSYRFELTVVDRQGQSAAATLMVEIAGEAGGEAGVGDAGLDTEDFQATRVGAAGVSSTADLRFDWKTVESSQVVIRLSPEQAGAYFFPLVSDDYKSLKTQAELVAAARRNRPMATLDIATASNQAAGQVFGFFSDDAPMILRISRSETSLSEIGTTVTLEGEYKF
jgi:hypothetical protein